METTKHNKEINKILLIEMTNILLTRFDERDLIIAISNFNVATEAIGPANNKKNATIEKSIGVKILDIIGVKRR